MAFQVYGLEEDPFLLKSTTNEQQLSMIPFIPTESYQVIENRVFYHFKSPSSSKIPLYLSIVGNIGVGKSTALLHLKKRLEEQKFRVAYLSSSYKGESWIYRDITGSYQSYSRVFVDKWDKTRSIVLFDVPDSANRTHLAKMASFMQTILVKHLTSIIPVFNRAQLRRFESLGTILGKFSSYTLTPFTVDDTKNMIYKRLERTRKKPHKDPFYPFNEEIIEKIHKIAQGHPRNALDLASLLIESEKGKISIDLLKEVSKTDYITRVLNLRYSDSYKIQILKEVVDVIDSEFNGIAPSQGALTDAIKEKLGFSKITAVKKIKELEKSKLLLIYRNDEQPWCKTHQLVTTFD